MSTDIDEKMLHAFSQGVRSGDDVGPCLDWLEEQGLDDDFFAASLCATQHVCESCRGRGRELVPYKKPGRSWIAVSGHNLCPSCQGVPYSPLMCPDILSAWLKHRGLVLVGLTSSRHPDGIRDFTDVIRNGPIEDVLTSCSHWKPRRCDCCSIYTCDCTNGWILGAGIGVAATWAETAIDRPTLSTDGSPEFAMSIAAGLRWLHEEGKWPMMDFDREDDGRQTIWRWHNDMGQEQIHVLPEEARRIIHRNGDTRPPWDGGIGAPGMMVYDTFSDAVIAAAKAASELCVPELSWGSDEHDH